MRHKVNIKISLLLAFLLLGTFGTEINAQQATVTTVKGVVTDEFGQPLQGVVVNSSKGTNGSSTDIKGAYILTVNDGSDAIVFSLVGYKDETKSILGKEEVDAVLQLDVHKKDEIVEMGWTRQRREDISGAVTSVKADRLEAVPVANLTPALSGQVPGLGITEFGNSVPAHTIAAMWLRGYSNPKSGNVMVLIDGVPNIWGPEYTINYMDPREIESITLLKDASTQAMYGLKAGDGVVAITTKRGRKGPVTIDVTYDQSVQQPTTTRKWYGSAEYATFKNQIAYNDNPSKGRTSVYSAQDIANYISGEDRDLYPNNNWRDMFMKKLGTMSRANVNISGGSDKFSYFTNVNFMHQSNMFKSTHERYKNGFNDNWFNYRSNVDIKVNKYLSAYLRLAGSIRRDRNPNYYFESLYQYLYYVPAKEYGPLTPPVYDTDGTTLLDAGGKAIVTEKWNNNLYQMLNRNGYEKTTETNISSQFGAKLDMSFLTKGLSLNAFMAYQTYNTGMLYAYQSSYERYRRTSDPTRLEFTRYGTTQDDPVSYGKTSWNFYHLDYLANLDYQRTFGKHSVQAMAYMFFQNLVTQDYRAGWLLPYNTMLNGVEVSYGFDNRYLVKFNMGYSGSEQFNRDHRFIATPSVSGAWVVSNEPFMKNAEWLSLLKIRASYGKTATDALGLSDRFAYTDNITFNAGGIVPNLQYVTTEGTKGNPLLQASTMKKQNYGIDFGLFNGLTISFDYYQERMDDLLINAISTIPMYQGIPLGNYPTVQQGKFENKGYDLTVNYFKQFNKDWSFNVGGWVSYNRNKIVYQDEADQGENFAYHKRSEGFPLGQAWALKWDAQANGNGFYNSQSEIDNSDLTYGWSLPTPKPGDLVFKDMNGDYVIDDKDVSPVGYGAAPQVFYAFNAGFRWKNLEVNVLFQGLGRYATLEGGGSLYGTDQDGIYNRLHEGAWTAERYAAGDKITFPRMSASNQTSSYLRSSDYFLQDRAYLRLKNLEIAYTLPLKVSQKISSDRIRFSFSGQNLVTWDRMKSKDYGPEGTLYGVPVFRVYSLGVSMLF